MNKVLVALVSTSAFSTVAHAASDAPIIAPAPAWVKPVAPAAAPPATDETPVRLLLVDQQVALEPGRTTVYSETVFRIQTAQGLGAGNISLPWRPEIDTLTVHKLLIRRGDQTIDVLKSGQTFTVLRREQNLESATLDGVRTANIQPEGLQVGDTVEIALSVASSDPTLKGHVEQFAADWNGMAIGRAHLRMQWPSSVKARIRQTAALPVLKPVTSGTTTSVELSLNDVQPVLPPKGAPARYRLGRLVEVTDFASWADLGALMAPLYEKAATIPAQGPLRTELDRIRSLSADPKARATAALALVQDRIRYVALAMGTGGYVPADAETTWARRFGDCKGKTALLLALLHALGVAAEPVAVNTAAGDGLDARLPMVAMFNHVLVRATIDGKTYWLDGTRTGDTSLDRLTTPYYGWGLPLVARGAALVAMVPEPLTVPTSDVAIRIDASKGISAPAPVTIETILRGDDAIGIQKALATLAGEARERALKEYWKAQYDFIEVKSATMRFDAPTGELQLSMAGDAKLDWANGNYQTDGTNVGYRADFSREAGPDRDAPFAVAYPYYLRTRETIVLPRGRGEFKLGTGMEVDQTAGGIAYRRHASIVDGVFSIEKTERSVKPEFPAKDAPAEQAALRMLADRAASVRMPSSYKYSGADVTSVEADVPTTSAGFVTRARAFVDRGMREAALADYDRAVALDPNNVYAWSNRAMTRIQAGDLAGAKADLAKADAVDPTFVQNALVYGMLADAEQRTADAAAAYTRALEREPDNSYALYNRAQAYARLGLRDRAIADLSRSIAKDPEAATRYVARGNAYLDMGKLDAAIADFDKAHALEPDDEWALADRGLAHAQKRDFAAATADFDAVRKINPRNPVLYRGLGILAEQQGKPEDAIAAFTEALAIDPASGFALGHRAKAQHAAGHDDAALADAAAALAQQPRWAELYLLRANIYRIRGDRDRALAEAATLSAASPDDSYAQVAAANIYAAFQQNDAAMQAFDRALALKPEAYVYINRSERRPKADLAGRRADIDAALRLEPDLVPALAEKALLQAEAGDLAGAIATYTAAAAKDPNDAGLLTARGIAYLRMGDAARGEADFQRARQLATEAAQLNNMCWAKATAGVGLASALADCDAALAKAPGNGAFLDSRALVLLRLGRIDDAIADYGRALAKNPAMASSLFGRALAWARKGDQARAEADAAAARAIEPDIARRFEDYGLKR
ncbi:tetratricopeptide repeat protein [uncultured Sphingomonas sp.]|uniref:tetratricopeptide repeat protein n=1 Tax=uncultured Sphingomonas sp. TaxID=158754 RepID=UPI0025D80754|nr:tetratricopeptide repeat protein [uncultured Sphingomonas sp.]